MSAKLLDAADVTTDTSTTTNHGTGGAVTRTEDPYTGGTASDLDQTLYGWAVTPTDMNSVAGARRFYPAGDHTLTARMSQQAATGTGATVTLTMYVYRVGPSPGRTRTLLGSATSAAFTLPGLSAVVTATVTVSLAEIIFEDDETIQYSVEVTGPGLIVTGRIYTFRTGTEGGEDIRIDTPRLGVLKDTTGTADGSDTVLALMSTVLGTVGTGSGTSAADGLLSAVAASTGSADGSSTALGLLSAVAGTVGTADGDSTADGLLSVVLGTTGTATVGAVCPEDWPVNDGLKEIAGDVFFHEPPNQGDPVVGAVVTLIRDSDGLLITTTVTDAAGHYSFPRDTNDPYTYHVEVRYTDIGGDQQGLSESGCSPQ